MPGVGSGTAHSSQNSLLPCRVWGAVQWAPKTLWSKCRVWGAVQLTSKTPCCHAGCGERYSALLPKTPDPMPGVGSGAAHSFQNSLLPYLRRGVVQRTRPKTLCSSACWGGECSALLQSSLLPCMGREWCSALLPNSLPPAWGGSGAAHSSQTLCPPAWGGEWCSALLPNSLPPCLGRE